MTFHHLVANEKHPRVNWLIPVIVHSEQFARYVTDWNRPVVVQVGCYHFTSFLSIEGKW